MAYFYEKEIPWIPAQLQGNSDFSQLESYLYAIRNNLLFMKTDEMRSLICSIICDTINWSNLNNKSPKITKENLTEKRIEKFINDGFSNIYKFGEINKYDFSFSTIFRVLDYYNIKELKCLCQFIYEELFNPNTLIDWEYYVQFFRSDYFVNSSSLEVLVSAFKSFISTPTYINGEPFAPWTISNEQWDGIEGYNLMVAAGFLFSWNRCKSRLIQHNDLYTSCQKLAEEACTLLLKNQNADGSWDQTTLPSFNEYLFKLLPTSYAVLALSLCHDDRFSTAIQSAHDWLLCRLADDQFLNEKEYVAFDTVVMDAILLSDEKDNQSNEKVSFSVDSVLLPENGPRLPRAHIKFLHLSDIHFSLDMDNRISASIRKALISQIDTMSKEGTKITDLIFTGDFRHARFSSSAKVNALVDDAVDYINELARAARINDPEHIHLVPGNHDINRKYFLESSSMVDKEGKKITFHDLYKSQYYEKKGLFPDEAIKIFGSQLYFFRKIALKIYNKNNPWKNAKLHTYHYVDGTVFLYLNTAIYHHDDSDRGKLIIGVHYVEDVLEEIKKRYPDVPIVVLAHHSPDYFDVREKTILEKVFLKYPISLYLCGDAHMPWWRMTNGHLEFTAGCIKDENGSQSEFLYGDAANYRFTSYIWDNNQGWGEFSAFNTSLESFLEVMNMKSASN